MLKMEHVHVIRHKIHIEGQSIRRVAKDLRLSRTTVAKYFTQSAPARRASPPRIAPVHAHCAKRIEELIEEWRRRTTPKQRITGTRLHRQLIEEGFSVGKTTIYEHLRQRRRQSAEVFIPLTYRAGETAQVDFFEVTVDVAGERRQVWKFVMRLMHSGYDFAWMYERCERRGEQQRDGAARRRDLFGAGAVGAPARDCLYRCCRHSFRVRHGDGSSPSCGIGR
jgi:transposase